MNHSLLKSAAFVVLALAPLAGFAGGPLLVGGPAVGNRPAYGIDGQPFTWNPSKMPIQYRVDPGPLATTSSGTVVIPNATGLQRIQSMLAIWSGVSTAAVSFKNAGSLLPAGSYTGGDLKTVSQYNDVVGSCNSANQNPIIFDSDGSLMSALGMPPEVIGFTSACALDTTNGFITAASILLNGKFQDGVDNSANYELTANQFDETITHEFGHFLGLDHSQINLDLYTSGVYPCPVDDLAGMPLMFPIEFCQARKDAGLPILAPDDVAWISKLYPNSNQVSNYAVISGRIFFSDGQSQFQGANVIARLVDDQHTARDESRRVAVSVVSGFLFTGNPGQSVTASLPDPTENNVNGSKSGSRNPQLIGYYEIPVPPGTYTVEVEALNPGFPSDSGLGPLPFAPQLPGFDGKEYWNLNESAFDFPLQADTITVNAGDKVTDIDIILNSTGPRFDIYEDDGAFLDPPVFSPVLDMEEKRA